MEIKNQNKKKGGFTLIELMVAISIFTMIMLVAMGSLFTMLDSAKGARALRLAMDNVNFAMESMTRSIRMGTNYNCSSTDLNNLNSYSNSNSNSTCQNSKISFKPQTLPPPAPEPTSKIAYGLGVGAYNKSIVRCNGISCTPITSPDVKIEELKFVVNGSSPTDNKQASVYIIVKGTVTVKKIDHSFAIQTMASQRNY